MNTLTEVLSMARGLAKKLDSIESDAMSCAISLNMHGFKRLHEKQANGYHCYGLKIVKEGMDMTKKPLAQMSVEAPPFYSENIRIHLEKLIPALKDVMAQLIECNKKSLDLIGMHVKPIKCMQKCLFEEIMDYERWHKAYADCGWNLQYIYQHDKILHEKLKRETEGDK